MGSEGMRNDTESLFRKYSDKADTLREEVSRLEKELQSSRDRLELVLGMLADMQALRGRELGGVAVSPAAASAVPAAPAPAAAKPVPAPERNTVEPPVAPPISAAVRVSPGAKVSPAARPGGAKVTPGVSVAPEVPAKRPGPGRPRGSSKAAKRAARMESILANGTDKELSIVDAAIEYARREGARQAKAGDVHDWFVKYGYQSNRGGGVPNRNSIYVSLNREAGQTEGDPNPRIEKISRGEFLFNHKD